MICKELRDKMWTELKDEAKAFIKTPHQAHNLNIYHLLCNIKMLDEMLSKEGRTTEDKGMWS